MMVKRFVKVMAVGYLEIREEDLKMGYQADTFEQAVDNQRRWYEDDPEVPFQEYVSSGRADITFELMPEDFIPED